MLQQWEWGALDRAFDLAAGAGARGDVPVGALLFSAEGSLLGTGANARESAPFDPTAHAEILALRAGARALGRWNLSGTTLVVTLEPCTMCAGAIVAARVSRLVFAAWDEKAGACGSVRDVVRDSRLNHQVEVWGGVDQGRGEKILFEFFKTRRDASLNRRDTSLS